MDARGPKYTVNGIGFSSKKAVQDHCRGIIKRTTNGLAPQWGTYLPVSDEDQQFMLDFIRFDPDYLEIVGCGIVAIQVGYVGSDIGKPHWGFYVLRNDGSEERFGFRDFNKTPCAKETDRVKDAKRNAIAIQTIEYKERYFDGHEEAICEATGVLMTRTGNGPNSCQVDHEHPTFKQLEQMFFNGWEPELEHDGSKWQISTEWDDVKASWQEFHRKHAKLRCVTRAFNLSRKDAADESP